MEVELHQLTETNKSLDMLKLHPEDNPVGFYDNDGSFMAVVMDNGVVKKKRIAHKNLKVNINKPVIDHG